MQIVLGLMITRTTVDPWTMRGLGGGPTLHAVQNSHIMWSQPFLYEVPLHPWINQRGSWSTIVLTIEKSPHVSGSTQFKPMLYQHFSHSIKYLNICKYRWRFEKTFSPDLKQWIHEESYTWGQSFSNDKKLYLLISQFYYLRKQVDDNVNNNFLISLYNFL